MIRVLNNKIYGYIGLVFTFLFFGCSSTNSSSLELEAKLDSIHAHSNLCKAGNALSCQKAGLGLHRLCEQNIRTEKTCPGTLRYYKKGCDLNNRIACNVLSGIYKGSHHKLTQYKDTRLFVEYAEKAFNLGDRIYAKDLALYYKLGRGIKKDSNKFIYYTKVQNDKSFILKFPTYSSYAHSIKYKVLAEKKKNEKKRIEAYKKKKQQMLNQERQRLKEIERQREIEKENDKYSKKYRKPKVETNPCSLTYMQYTEAKEHCDLLLRRGGNVDYKTCYKSRLIEKVKAQGCKNY